MAPEMLIIYNALEGAHRERAAQAKPSQAKSEVKSSQDEGARRRVERSPPRTACTG